MIRTTRGARGFGYGIPCTLPSHFSDWKIAAATSATDSSPPSNRRPTPCEESTRPCPAAGVRPRDAREEKGEGRPLLSRVSGRWMTRMGDKGTGGGGGMKLLRSSDGVKGSKTLSVLRCVLFAHWVVVSPESMYRVYPFYRRTGRAWWTKQHAEGINNASRCNYVLFVFAVELTKGRPVSNVATHIPCAHLLLSCRRTWSGTRRRNPPGLGYPRGLGRPRHTTLGAPGVARHPCRAP